MLFWFDSFELCITILCEISSNFLQFQAQEAAGRTSVENMTAEEIKAEKKGILKNVFLISFAFLLLFTAFQSMSALQSSINKVP